MSELDHASVRRYSNTAQASSLSPWRMAGLGCPEGKGVRGTFTSRFSDSLRVAIAGRRWTDRCSLVSKTHTRHWAVSVVE